MEAKAHEPGMGGSPAVDRVKLSFSLEALDALPDVGAGRKAIWTPAMDEGLLKHWNRACKKDVARVLGVSYDTARERYDRLTKRQA